MLSYFQLRPLGRAFTTLRTLVHVRKGRTLCLIPTMANGKLDCPQFTAVLTLELVRLESLFRSEGYGFRLVGGVVRDMLLGKVPKDIDIATDCTPDAMIELFETHGIRYIPTGLQHGTITVHMESGKDYELTTLRVDRITDGRHAVVDFTNDWKLDALRRDLTINAMGVALDGTLYDYFNGLKHLAENRVLFVGDSRTRIREDYLRILRYFRFYGRIVPEIDKHDKDTLQAIQENAEGLRGVSVERVWSEIKKILVGNHAPHLIQLIYKLGVAHCIGLPRDGSVKELEQVWTTMIRHGETLQPVSLLMCLIQTVQEAYDLAHTWKLSNDEKRLGVFVVQHRHVAYKTTTSLKYYQDLLVDGSPSNSVFELLHYCDKSDMAEELKKWEVPKLPVNGKDLKGAGFQPGCELGSILRLLKTKWKESTFTLNKEELLELGVKTKMKQGESKTSTSQT